MEQNLVKWKNHATQMQQWFFENLGNREWDYIDARWKLKKKVGYALFCDPKFLPNDWCSSGYANEQEAKIVQLCDVIYKKCGSASVDVAFLFVLSSSYDNAFPVFKVGTNYGAVFIDHIGRVYKSWYDFKRNNKLDGSLLCYPKEGRYKSGVGNKVLLEFAPSPTCASKVRKNLSEITKGVQLGALGVGIAGLFTTIAAPVALAATIGYVVSTGYGMIEGSVDLHDRRTHEKSISLSDGEARNSWLLVFSGAFGLGSGLAVSRIASVAARGGQLTKTASRVTNFLNYGSLAVSSIGMVQGLVGLMEEDQKGQLDELKLFQFFAQAFFFCASARNIKSADGIMREVKEGIMSDISGGLSKRRMKAFKRVVNANTAEELDNIIKGFSKIGSKYEFFRLLLKGQLKCDKGIKFNQEGILVAKGKPFLDTKAGVNYPISYKHGDNFFSIPNVNSIIDANPSYRTVEIVQDVLKGLEKNSVENNGIPFNLDEDLKSKLSCVFNEYCFSKTDEDKKKEFESVIQLTSSFARDRNCSSNEMFISYTQFLCIYRQRKLRKMKRSMDENVEQFIHCGLDKTTLLNEKQGIMGAARSENELLECVDKEIRESNESLREEFDKYNDILSILNEEGSIKFRSCRDAVIQFYHCFVINVDEKLTPKEYFDVIRKTVENKSSRINESGRHEWYYDEMVPVLVEVENIDGCLFFVKTRFQDLGESDEED